MFRRTLERVIERFTEEAYRSEIDRARSAYFEATGKVFEDEPMCESRMTAFLEWYLFDWVLADYGVPPVRLFALAHSCDLDEEERPAIEGLQHTNHSLFLLEGRKDGGIVVRDLFDDASVCVSERRSYTALLKGDILDARIVTVGGTSLFCDALWVHPSEVREFILREAREKRAEGREAFSRLTLDLAHLKLRRDRYQHIPAKTIYTWDTLRRERGAASSP